METYSKCVAGIDLGTTNSCICIYKDQKVEVVVNSEGKRTTPSIVSFTNEGRRYGKTAKQQAVRNCENTVFDVKRMIGHKFSDSIIQEEIKRWPFIVKEDETGSPIIHVKYGPQEYDLHPEQISGYLIEDLVAMAKVKTQEEITDIVITVPAYFNDNQRQATIDAGKLAGYNVLGLLNEPTAAAIAYGFENIDKTTNILVYDLGGGTFDVTILTVDHKVYTVRGTDGDTHLGGDDLDYIMMDILKDSIALCGSEIDNKNKKTMMRLRQLAEEVKINLSQMESYEVDDSVLCDEPFDVTRFQFEERSKPFFDKTRDVVNRLLADRNMACTDIDDVVLIGGSSRIPYVKKMLEEMFGKDHVYERINPDEAVAKGAVIKAVQLKYQQEVAAGRIAYETDSRSDSETDSQSESDSDEDENGTSSVRLPDITRIRITDVVPLSMGVKTSAGRLGVIVPKSEPYPCHFTRNYVTSKDNQTKMKIRVYQGEREFVVDDYQIGVFNVTGITPLPRGEASVDVTMSIDLNGILKVTVMDLTTNKETSVTFDKESTNLSLEDVLKMKREAVEMRENDLLMVKRQSLFNDIENAMYFVERLYNESKDALEPDIGQSVEGFLEGIREFLKVRDADITTLENNRDIAQQWVAFFASGDEEESNYDNSL